MVLQWLAGLLGYKLVSRQRLREIARERRKLRKWEEELDERSRILNECGVGMHAWGRWSHKPGSVVRKRDEDGTMHEHPVQSRVCEACGFEESVTYPVWDGPRIPGQ